MKIEFRKVPQISKELEIIHNSVKIEGTFCKISQSLVKVDAELKGSTDVDCCRCGATEMIEVDEKLHLLLSDGVYKKDESDYLVIEIEDSLINFEDIIESELNSIRSDYHICDDCLQLGDNFEKEF